MNEVLNILWSTKIQNEQNHAKYFCLVVSMYQKSCEKEKKKPSKLRKQVNGLDGRSNITKKKQADGKNHFSLLYNISKSANHWQKNSVILPG